MRQRLFRVSAAGYPVYGPTLNVNKFSFVNESAKSAAGQPLADGDVVPVGSGLDGLMPTPSATEAQMSRVGSQTAVYVIGVLLGRALSFLLLPLYTRYLSPASYGIIQLVELTFDIMTLIAGARLASGLFHFYEKADNPRAKHKVLSTTLLTLTATYGAVSFVSFLFAEQLSRLVFHESQYTGVIRIAAVSFLFQGMLIVPLADIRRRERPLLFVMLSSGKLVAQAALNVFFLVVMGLGLESMFISTLLASGVLALWLSVQLLRRTGLGFSRNTFNDILRFGVPLVATQVATIFTTFGDRFFLQRAVDAGSPTGLSGEAAVGLYALAYQFGFLLQSVGVDPFFSVWGPLRFEIAKHPNRDAVFSRGFLLLNLLLVTMATGIALYVGDVIHLIAAPAYHDAAKLVPIILVAYVLQGWSMTLDTGLLIRERTEYVTLANWVSAVVALAGYVYLIPRYFGWGAAWATVAAYAVRQVIVYYASQRIWPVRYEWGPVIRLNVIALALVTIRLVLPAMRSAYSLLVSTVFFAGYLATVWYSRILPLELRAIAGRLRRSPRQALSDLLGATGVRSTSARAEPLSAPSSITRVRSVASATTIRNTPDSALTLDLRAEAKRVIGPLIDPSRKIALVDFPNHSNVGDSAIWCGELALLRHLDVKEISYVCDGSTYNRQQMANAVGPDGLVLLHGGGNLGDLWPWHQKLREVVVTDFPDHEIVQLPQTIQFREQDALDRCRRIFDGHRHLTLVARATRSFEFAESLFNIPVVMAPDTAFWNDIPADLDTPDLDILWLKRTDRESGGSAEISLPPRSLRDDWLDDTPSFIHRLNDTLRWPLQRLPGFARGQFGKLWTPRFCEALASERMDRGLRMLRRGRVVITDRLHAHILSEMLGIPHVIMANNYPKLRAFYDTWMHGSTLAHWAETEEEALALAAKLLAHG